MQSIKYQAGNYRVPQSKLQGIIRSDEICLSRFEILFRDAKNLRLKQKVHWKSRNTPGWEEVTNTPPTPFMLVVSSGQMKVLEETTKNRLMLAAQMSNKQGVRNHLKSQMWALMSDKEDDQHRVKDSNIAWVRKVWIYSIRSGVLIN